MLPSPSRPLFESTSEGGEGDVAMMYTPSRPPKHGRTGSEAMLADAPSVPSTPRVGQHHHVDFSSALNSPVYETPSQGRINSWQGSPGSSSERSPFLGYNNATPSTPSSSPVSSRFHSGAADKPRRPASRAIAGAVLPFASKRMRGRSGLFCIFLLLLVALAFLAPLEDERPAGFAELSLADSDVAAAPGAALPARIQQSLGALRKGIKHGVKHGVNWSKNALPAWTSASSSIPQHGPIKISVLPKPRLPSGNPSEKFIGFLPHSGYHNQRSALVAALTLGKRLNRTVLLPPVWLGWPTGWMDYNTLQEIWNTALLDSRESFQLSDLQSVNPASSSLFEPGAYRSIYGNSVEFTADHSMRAIGQKAMESTKNQSSATWIAGGYEILPDGYPVTNLTSEECKSYSPECRHTYKNTFLSWDTFVDLDALTNVTGVKVVDRWDMRERALERSLGVGPGDFYVLRDEVRYEFQFHDDLSDDNRRDDVPPLIRPNTPEQKEADPHNSAAHIVSLRTLSRLPQRVLLVGTLFGSSRVTPPDYQEMGVFNRALAFRSPWLLKPARAIRHRLGGPEGYVGVHARVGDGRFKREADKSMEQAWHDLTTLLKIDPSIVEIMWELVRPIRGLENAASRSKARDKPRMVKHSAITEQPEQPDDSSGHLDEPEDAPSRPAPPRSSRHARRQIRGSAVLHPGLRFLHCRGTLHTSQDYLLFNTPVYLATDALYPTDDPSLEVFFKAFPCTFVLSDFTEPSEMNGGELVNSIGELMRLVNKNDDVDLGRLYLPFLEAVVAAMGFITIGTPASTFSNFARYDLHEAYRLDLETETDDTPRDEQGRLFSHWR